MHAKSKFWYFLSKLRKAKRASGQILAVHEIHEKRPLKVKNFAVHVRYNSRSGTHNMLKEYRDVTVNGAIEQMYCEMASRHRARKDAIQVLDTAAIPASKVRRVNTLQFLDSHIKFPLQRNFLLRSPSSRRATFRADRPSTTVFSKASAARSAKAVAVKKDAAPAKAAAAPAAAAAAAADKKEEKKAKK